MRYSLAALRRERRTARLCRLSPPAGAARPRHEPRRLPGRPRRRGGAEDAAALGRSRGARGRLGQDPHVLPARRLRRVLRRSGYFSVKSTMEFTVKVNGVDAARRLLLDDRSVARHARRFGSGPLTPMKPRLLVGIDTEGDNQWDLKRASTRRSRTSTRCRSCTALFETHGVRPTYVVTWPVASDERSQEVLRFLLLRGDCEIGAHHHAWETPPCSAEDVSGTIVCRVAAGLDQFEAQLAAADRGDRAGGRRAAGLVSIRPLRLRRRARLRARALRLSRRVERRAALLRGAQGRAGLRRSAARRRISWRTTPPCGRARAACSRCRVRPHSIAACRRRWRAPTRVRRGRT